MFQTVGPGSGGGRGRVEGEEYRDALRTQKNMGWVRLQGMKAELAKAIGSNRGVMCTTALSECNVHVKCL